MNTISTIDLSQLEYHSLEVKDIQIEDNLTKMSMIKYNHKALDLDGFIVVDRDYKKIGFKSRNNNLITCKMVIDDNGKLDLKREDKITETSQRWSYCKAIDRSQMWAYDIMEDGNSGDHYIGFDVHSKSVKETHYFYF